MKELIETLLNNYIIVIIGVGILLLMIISPYVYGLYFFIKQNKAINTLYEKEEERLKKRGKDKWKA